MIMSNTCKQIDLRSISEVPYDVVEFDYVKCICAYLQFDFCAGCEQSVMY